MGGPAIHSEHGEACKGRKRRGTPGTIRKLGSASNMARLQVLSALCRYHQAGGGRADCLDNLFRYIGDWVKIYDIDQELMLNCQEMCYHEIPISRLCRTPLEA